MDFKKNELEFFSIHGLRNIGREIGVKAPSSLKKAELIENILKVQDGTIPPHVTKKGRPALQSKPQDETTPQAECTEEEIREIIKNIIERSKEKVEKELRESERLFLQEVLAYNPPSKNKKK